MPNPCQPDGEPFNTWNAFWASYADGANDGFVEQPERAGVDGLPRRRTMLPFMNSLAATFPVCDRYFCSVGAQTYPNRRFLMAGTSLGLLTDIFPSAAPPNGTIFQSLDAHGISWKNYYSTLPSVAHLVVPGRRCPASPPTSPRSTSSTPTPPPARSRR